MKNYLIVLLPLTTVACDCETLDSDVPVAGAVYGQQIAGQFVPSKLSEEEFSYALEASLDGEVQASGRGEYFGRYRVGHLTGALLVLGHSRYLCYEFACMPGRTNIDYGDYHYDNGGITLDSDLGKPPSNLWWGGGELLVVKWGERRYLVPERELSAFERAVSKGLDPIEDMPILFLIRMEDRDIPVTGAPEFPPDSLGSRQRGAEK